LFIKLKILLIRIILRVLQITNDMKNFEHYKSLEPYSLNKKEKRKFFDKEICNLTIHHYKNSPQYKKIFDTFGYQINDINLEKIPFLPTKLFKQHDLLSVKKEKVLKTLISSGTSSSYPSKIHLDKENAYNQVKVLNKIMSSILGNHRLPMLIIDQNPKILDKSIFNARATAIYGFSIFGKNQTYLLNEKNEIDYNILNAFLDKFSNANFFIFGFTFQIYQNLIKKISNKFLKHDFKNGILLHGGGWKKMEKIKVSNELFKEKLQSKFKLINIYNYYGLVEQTGSIFLECQKCSCFVTTIFSDIIIRDKNFNILRDGERGLIQLFSLLPKSYPGHSILTEDIGEIVNNDCACRDKGKRFKVYGRAKESEIRGCSDT